jgi:hypothetical protein
MRSARGFSTVAPRLAVGGPYMMLWAVSDTERTDRLSVSDGSVSPQEAATTSVRLPFVAR